MMTVFEAYEKAFPRKDAIVSEDDKQFVVSEEEYTAFKKYKEIEAQLRAAESNKEVNEDGSDNSTDAD